MVSCVGVTKIPQRRNYMTDGLLSVRLRQLCAVSQALIQATLATEYRAGWKGGLTGTGSDDGFSAAKIHGCDSLTWGAGRSALLRESDIEALLYLHHAGDGLNLVFNSMSIS